MQGMKISAQNDVKMKTRINDNTSWIHRMSKSPCPPDVVIDDTYWDRIRIEDFLPMNVDKIDKK
jgi:hypothetical protein